MENSNISSHDKAVLTRIFNPNLPYGDTYDEEDTIEQQNGIVIYWQRKCFVFAPKIFVTFLYLFFVQILTDLLKEQII